MSKLGEYLKLLPKGIMNLSQVIDGYRNQIRMELGTIPPEDEEVILGRRLICHGCPLMSRNAQAAGWYTTQRDDDHCTCCGCPISTRTASLEANCGIEDCNNKNPNAPQMELKWTKVR